MKPSADDWQQWLASPVAEWFFKEFLPAEIKRTFDAFTLRGWDTCPQVLDHARMRERADTLQWIARARFEDFLAAEQNQQELNERVRKLPRSCASNRNGN